jgi:hypothetical protein
MDKTFSAVGVSESITIPHLEEFSYTVTASTDPVFDGRLYLERSDNGGLAWAPTLITASGYVINYEKDAKYRFRCNYSAVQEVAETPTLTGTVAVSTTETAETVKIFENSRGVEVAKVTETGFDADVLTQAGVQVVTTTGTQTLTNKTLTSPALNGPVVVGDIVKVTDAATYTILAANSGKIHIIPDLTADCVLSLPTPANGLRYTFMYGGVAADAHDWTFDTKANVNFYKGGLVQHDPDSAGDDTAVYYPDGNSNSIVKIDTPDAGTKVELICDGTNWFLNGTVISATDTGVAFSDQA